MIAEWWIIEEVIVIDILIYLVIAGAGFYVAYLIVGMIPIPPTIKQWLTILLAVLFLILLVYVMGGLKLPK